MSEPELLRAPLLNGAIGTRRNDFIIHENQDTGPRGLPRGGIPLHLHRVEDEAWYILQGNLRFRYGEREFDAAEGTGVLLPHGTAHTFWNPGPGPARYLLIVGPKTEGLLEYLHATRIAGPSELKELYASFDVELLE